MKAVQLGFLAFACFLGTVPSTSSQAATGTRKLEFEVASVRESKSEDKPASNFPLNPGPQFGDVGGVLRARNTLLLQYIVFAYKPNSWQIQVLRQGLPDWTRSARFDIEAKASGTATKDEMRTMMRSLLEDRFGMRVHTEMRDTRVFDLVLARPEKLGPKLVQHPADDPDCHKVPLAQTAAGGYPHQCGTYARIAASGPGLDAVGGQNIAMDDFVLGLTGGNDNGVDRPVQNRTGLTGTYDFTLEWAIQSSDPAVPSSDAGPSFFDALREQLGLKLVPDKAPVEFIVVDKIEHPTAN